MSGSHSPDIQHLAHCIANLHFTDLEGRGRKCSDPVTMAARKLQCSGFPNIHKQEDFSVHQDMSITAISWTIGLDLCAFSH